MFVFEGQTLLVSFTADVTFILMLTACLLTNYDFQTVCEPTYLNIYLHAACVVYTVFEFSSARFFFVDLWKFNIG